MPKKWPSRPSQNASNIVSKLKYREAFQVIRHATEKSYVYFAAVILKVLLVNLLAALNFANVFFK